MIKHPFYRAFTLNEILIVIAIVVLPAAWRRFTYRFSGNSFAWYAFVRTFTTMIGGYFAAFFLARGYQPNPECVYRSTPAQEPDEAGEVFEGISVFPRYSETTWT